jgi:hypothetical protein
MKIKLMVILAVVTMAMASCSQHRTCATYLKNTKEVKQERF